MNMSNAISSIIQQLGLYNISLPFEESVENVIQNVIKTTTIPIYSEYVPNVKELMISTRDLKVIDRKQGIFQIPDLLCTSRIMYVLDVEVPMYTQRGAYGDITPAYGISRSVQGVITSKAYGMVASQMRAEPTFDYIGQNKIRLYGYPSGYLTFRVACEHDANGESIPITCYQSFMELAELDVKVFLYNTLKNYDKIATAFGNIDLKIEDYQSAITDRKTLLDQWTEVFHLDQPDLITFFS